MAHERPIAYELYSEEVDPVTRSYEAVGKVNFCSLMKCFVFFILMMSCERTSLQSDNSNLDSLRAVLEKMYDDDQNIRRILVDSIGLTSPLAPIYIQKMNKIDSVNSAQIERILQKYGWLEMSKIGEKASAGIFYVMQHSSSAFMEKYLDEVKRLARENEINKRHAALYEDRILMYRGKKQIYGTQIRTDLKEGHSVIWPIEDVLNVNTRRKEVGFKSTIEEYALKMGAVYNPDEQLPEMN